MEPSVEIYQPSRLYARIGWAALAGSLICILCGFRAPLAFIPGFLCAITGAALFWLAARPPIRIGENQFNIGERAIAWREVREINSSRFVSPLLLKIKLTNSRHKLLIFPGEPERIARLMFQLRKHSHLASFDGVAYRDYWIWSSLTGSQAENPTVEHPVRMLSSEDEDEIERMYQKLKTVGRLDSRSPDSKTSHED
ncbi:MAG: hypothetical protein JO097_21215 [Acidobacteriaceae bacterium]|nr:hypothetical protein [Acidobacteriaceae bacterium]MBV9295181.1 hypothetical protein [Acidobacteriaceae bacterium]MBV9766318.1 hypothetical protein [Acidobacteriaceae bacterium]